MIMDDLLNLKQKVKILRKEKQALIENAERLANELVLANAYVSDFKGTGNRKLVDRSEAYSKHIALMKEIRE